MHRSRDHRERLVKLPRRSSRESGNEQNWRQWALLDPGFAAPQEAAIDLRRALGQLRGGVARRAPGGVFGAPRPRPSRHFGDNFRLRHEIDGRGTHHFAQRFARGRTSAAGFRLPDSCFNRAPRGAVAFFFGKGLVAHVGPTDPVLPRGTGRDRRGLQRGVLKSGGTYLWWKLYGVSTKAVQRLSKLGHGRDRHDQPHRSQTGARAEICVSGWPW